MLKIYTMDDWSVSSPRNGVTEQGRRIGEYSALPADENGHSLSAHQDERMNLRRGYMAPRQYRLKKGHVENRLRNVRTMKLQIFIINIVDLTPHYWNRAYCWKTPGPASFVQYKIRKRGNMVYRHKKLVSRTIEKPITIDYLKILVTNCLLKDKI
jgi:hypothetical protein